MLCLLAIRESYLRLNTQLKRESREDVRIGTSSRLIMKIMMLVYCWEMTLMQREKISKQGMNFLMLRLHLKRRGKKNRRDCLERVVTRRLKRAARKL